MNTTKCGVTPGGVRILFYLAASLAGGCLAAITAQQAGPPLPAPKLAVEVEEDVYQYESANNGAGPMWCHGSTCLVRINDDVFASGLETIPDLKPLNNCRWTLFKRDPAGWKNIRTDAEGRTREPCPLVAFPDGRVFLSANPTLTPTNTYGGPARPTVLEFMTTQMLTAPRSRQPVWHDSPQFTEHSYRSFAGDGPNSELILFQNIGYTHAEWTYLDHTGQWAANGQLKWPWGAEYSNPQAIRVCYPNVALRNRAVHFCGVSDIIEPNPAWRAYKKELTGREWDYEFRRLFYTWAPDIRTGTFKDWIEIASRETTCGWITPGDLWVAPDGSAHLLWTERAIDERLRDKFFPQAKQSHALNYAIVRQGKVVFRQTLVLAEENGSREIPGLGRFHRTPDKRLFVVFYVNGRNDSGASIAENRIMEITATGAMGKAVRIPLQKPFNQFFTATIRGGSLPSRTLDLLGQRDGAPLTISYARIQLD